MSDDDLENDDLEVGDEDDGSMKALKLRPTTAPKMLATTTAAPHRLPRASPRRLSR